MTGNRQHIIHGLRDGIPIAMGYFAVTFSLGIIAARAGLTAPEAWLAVCCPSRW
jgi:predicted branched-subunit amino acid permease